MFRLHKIEPTNDGQYIMAIYSDDENRCIAKAFDLDVTPELIIHHCNYLNEVAEHLGERCDDLMRACNAAMQ